MTNKNEKNIEPLFIYDKGGPNKRHILKYNAFEAPKSFNIFDLKRNQKMDETKYDIIFGIKTQPDDFTKYDFLRCYDGSPLIVHQRVLDVLKSECPNDFQAFPVVIKNFDKKDPSFENHDYYAINVLNEVDCINRQKSDLFYKSEEDLAHDWFEIKRLVFNEQGIGSNCLVFLYRTRRYLIHPALAAKLRKCKGVEFRTAEQEYPGHPTPGEYIKYRYEEDTDKSLEALRQLMISLFNPVILKRFRETYKPDQEEAMLKGIELLKARSKMYDAECVELITFMESKR